MTLYMYIAAINSAFITVHFFHFPLFSSSLLFFSLHNIHCTCTPHTVPNLLLSPSQYSWDAAFYMLMASCFLSAVVSNVYNVHVHCVHARCVYVLCCVCVCVCVCVCAVFVTTSSDRSNGSCKEANRSAIISHCAN